MYQQLKLIRQELHKYPELSNQEYKTSEKIQTIVQQYKPDEVLKISKTGLAFVFDSKKEGETTVFRAELDALQISEKNDIEYTSVNEGVAHLCGHDGHMTILLGLVQKIAKKRPEKGRAVLLFQPAEEVEQGARDVVESYEFEALKPDYVFGLHNIPGIVKNTIIVKNGSFAAASKGMTIELSGKTSHAAEPENGINPAMAISEIVTRLNALIKDKKQFSDLALLTFIYIRMGEVAFGTSAGHAKIGITLRAFENADMDFMTQKAEEIIKEICQHHKLMLDIYYDEVFPATVNNDLCVEMVKAAAKEFAYHIEIAKKPFKWSEDFGYYTEKFKGGFFGLGSGENQPALHNPDFDFPDDILESGVNMFYSIYKEIHF